MKGIPHGAILCAAALLSAEVAQAGFIAVDFSASYNYDISSLLGYPTGSQLFNSVPFELAAGVAANDSWHSVAAPGDNPRTLEIPVNINNASAVYLLMNTFWGTADTPAKVALDFSGANGASAHVELVGGVDIRDYLDNIYTNTINGTSTINVHAEGPIRLDMVKVSLPAEFLAATLTNIQLSDSGASEYQRAFLYGVTVETAGSQQPAPEPHTWLLGGLGVALIAAAQFRKYVR